MWTYNFDAIKAQQLELHQQAAHYYLVKTVSKPAPGVSKALNALGQLLVSSGQGLIARTQAVN